MVTSFPAYLEGSLDTVKMEPPKNRLDGKVDFCDLPLSSSLLRQALLSSQACAAGAVCVGVGRGSFEGSLWLGGRLEGKGKHVLYRGEVVKGSRELTQNLCPPCPLPGKTHLCSGTSQGALLGVGSLLQEALHCC